MKRRKFLGITLMSAVAIPLPLAGCGSEGPFPPDDDETEAARVLRAYLCADGSALASARRIGTRYLARFGDEEEARTDLRPLVDRVLALASTSAAITELEMSVTSDFEDLRVLAVAGWTLAETEARICGVLAVAG